MSTVHKKPVVTHLSGRQWGAVVLTLIFGAALTVGGFWLAKKEEKGDVIASLTSRCDDYGDSVQSKAAGALEAVHDIGDLFDSSNEVTRLEFGTFANEQMGSHPGVLALEWAPRVPSSQIDDFVRAARKAGPADFNIGEAAAPKHPQGRGRRGALFPVLFAEPIGRNRRVLGFDLASDPESLRALTKARDTGQVAATGYVSMALDSQPEILMFRPVYRRGAPPASVAERRRRLLGFGVVVFRVGDLVEPVMAGANQVGIKVSIYDLGGGQKPALLHSSQAGPPVALSPAPSEGASPQSPPRYSRTVLVADRHWKIICEATPRFVARSLTLLPWGLLAGGLLATILLSLSVYSILLKNVSLEWANQRLERDITARRQAEEALSNSEALYRNLFERAGDAIFLLGTRGEEAGVILAANQAAEAMHGYGPGELQGKRINDLEPPGTPNSTPQRIERVLAGEGLSFEVVHLNKRGERFPLEVSAGLVELSNDSYILSIERDISERKRAEAELVESEERFRALSDKSPMGICMIDDQNRWQYVNPAFVDIFGYTLEDVPTGSDFLRRAYPDPAYRKQVAETWRRDLGKAPVGGVRIRTYAVTCKDGSQKFILFRSVTLADGRQLILYEDISERRRAEEALRLSEEKFAKAFRHSPLWVVLSTLNEGRYIEVNETFLRGTGYSREEVIGHTATDLGLRLDPRERDQMVRMVREQGSVRNLPVKRRVRSGEIRDMLLSAEMLPMPGEEALVAVLTDITERNQAQREKEALEAQLRQSQKLEALGTLAGGVAHDFNNILAAIMGYTELALGNTPSSSENHRFLDQILGAAGRAQRLVKQILTFGHKAEVAMKPLDLNRRVSDAVDLIRQTIPKMVDIELLLADGLRPISGDPGQIEQILMNLATNANDAMPEGGRLVIETENVSLDAEYCREHFEAQPGDYVRLQVSDTGVGMSKEVLGQVFDPFFTTKEAGKGTGLGLSTVYGIVQAHEGFIYCYSEPGQGTTFRLYFQALNADGTPQDSVSQTSGEQLGGSETILVVDDEEPLRNLALATLSLEGYAVETAGCGEEALEIYQRKGDEIDLVVLDVNMPGMGGHKCLLELVRLDPQVKVLVASGYSANGQLKDTLAAGARGYIAKPFERVRMLEIIRRILDE